ncbi:MAG TPA: phage holin family protein [Burkholderiaceae bacterium]|jgi:putative membrane protein|nr:phage holin family protein [Burkholderiaceae bacterium]
MRLLLGWAINALCLLALPWLLPAVKISGFGTALIAALVLGLLNTLIRPVLLLLTLPINLLTLGLFTFVINGLLFWLTARFLDGFEVAGFGWAVLAALVYSLISWAISALLLSKRE